VSEEVNRKCTPNSAKVAEFGDCCRIQPQIVAVSVDYSLQCGQSLRTFLAVNLNAMSALTGESRLQHLRVVVHVVLCVIICSCIFHPSSWSCIFWSSIFRQIWSSIFRSSNFQSSIFSAPVLYSCYWKYSMHWRRNLRGTAQAVPLLKVGRLEYA